jgi:hypothetical protein
MPFGPIMLQPRLLNGYADIFKAGIPDIRVGHITISIILYSIQIMK